MTMTIRAARAADIPRLLDLAEQRQRHYETFQPRFWRAATDARAQHEPYLRSLLEREDHIMLVSEEGDLVDGFIIGQLMAAPPVYDPGGPVCNIDDFVVARPDAWETIGSALLRQIGREAQQRGAVLSIVVSGHLDGPKRAMLTAEGFSMASEWWVRELE